MAVMSGRLQRRLIGQFIPTRSANDTAALGRVDHHELIPGQTHRLDFSVLVTVELAKAESKPRDLSKNCHQRSAHLGASGNLVLTGSHSISLGIFQRMEAKERRRMVQLLA
jgi:hypothetical protein